METQVAAGEAAPLDRSIVDGILPYLLPPSSTPIPSHLLSTPLRHRQHYLSLSPSDPEYFSWPSSSYTPQAIVELLAQSTHDPDTDWSPTVHYIAESESIAARVPIGSHVQLVFILDPESSLPPWKYHDTQPLPLPPHSHPSLASALAAASTNSSSLMDGPYEENPASYWAGFESPAPASPIRKSQTEDSLESIYWARYSNIQGTADSTIPSPDPELHRSIPPRIEINAKDARLSVPYWEPSVQQPPSHADIARTLTGLGDQHIRRDGLKEDKKEPEVARVLNEPNEINAAAEDVIRGIYRIWRVQNPSLDRDDFLQLVQRTIT